MKYPIKLLSLCKAFGRGRSLTGALNGKPTARHSSYLCAGFFIVMKKDYFGAMKKHFNAINCDPDAVRELGAHAAILLATLEKHLNNRCLEHNEWFEVADFVLSEKSGLSMEQIELCRKTLIAYGIIRAQESPIGFIYQFTK